MEAYPTGVGQQCLSKTAVQWVDQLLLLPIHISCTSGNIVKFEIWMKGKLPIVRISRNLSLSLILNFLLPWASELSRIGVMFPSSTSTWTRPSASARYNFSRTKSFQLSSGRPPFRLYLESVDRRGNDARKEVVF